MYISKNLHIKGDLTVDGSFTVTNFIKTKTFENTINKVIVSTIMEISNNGTGHALKVTQYGNDDHDKDVALFSYGNDLSAVEILHNGNTIFYKDASFQNNVDISNDLFVRNDVLINRHLSVPDASFQNNVEISNNLIVTHGEVSFNKLLKVPDASFDNIGSLKLDQ